MSTLLALAAAGYILIAVLSIHRRPGLFASAFLLSYGLATFFGSLGPILGGISLLAAAIGIAYKKEQQSALLPEWMLALWTGQMILSIFATPHMDIAIFYIASMCLLAVGSYLYARTFSKMPYFYEDALFGGIFITTLCLIQMVLTANASSLLGSDAKLTYVGLATLPEFCLAGSIAYLLFKPQKNLYITLSVICFIIFVLLPFLMGLGARSVALSIGIVFITLLGLRFYYGVSIKVLLAIAGFFLIAIAAIAIFWTDLEGTKLGSIILFGLNRLGRGVGSGDLSSDTSAQLRFELYDQAWNIFSRAPILGSGSGAFGYLADGAGGAYPHNMFLEILTQSGIVGLFIFLLFLIPLATRAIKRLLHFPVAWTAAFPAALMISGLIRHQFSISISQGKLLFFALGCTAAHVLMTREAKIPPSENSQHVDT